MKKYSISLLSQGELPILDIDTFPLSLSINWRYSLDEYMTSRWDQNDITKFLGKLTFLILSNNQWIINCTKTG
ncbi:hypothetical protein HYD78_02750 [Mycoplasmopsis bovis]|nr:hypothetical protein [Mycoplasmopsis bovis]QQH43365.1 hypothetical protein HYD78_02750 [Mycoplasmopsis bovis]